MLSLTLSRPPSRAVWRALPVVVALSISACAEFAAKTPAPTDSAMSGTDTNSVNPPPLVDTSNLGGTSEPDSGGVSSGGEFAPTGTVVGAKVQQMRGELTQLEGRVQSQASSLQSLEGRDKQNASTYFTTVAALNARLEAGTTPGNPRMVTQWNNAQSQLDGMARDLGSLNAMSTEITTSATNASFLTDTIRATFSLSGAVDEDHDALRALEDEAGRLSVQIDRMLTAITTDVTRQTSYVTSERRNLQTLSLAVANGQLYGQSLANRAYAAPNVMAGAGPIQGATSFNGTGTGLNGQKPLVVIRFDRPNVAFEQVLYQAASQALDRYPQAVFEVVAVGPTNGNPAQVALAASDSKRQADAVIRALAQMGLPSDRIRTSASSSAVATTPEVHVYVR